MKNRQEQLDALHKQDFQQQLNELNNKREIDIWEAWEESCRKFADVLRDKELGEYKRLYRLPLIGIGNITNFDIDATVNISIMGWTFMNATNALNTSSFRKDR